MSHHYSFPTRLALAHVMLARGAAPFPAHLADQYGAAGAEARVLHDRIRSVLPILVPDRTWRQRVDDTPSTDVRAYLLAAILDCTMVCCHLKRNGPQPAFVQLPLRRADCGRCVRTLRRPPANEADRCDVCGRPETLTFVPFAIRMGPMLVTGDACPSCAATLGIVQEVAS